MGIERADNDFTNAKYKKGDVVWFKHNGMYNCGRVIYRNKGLYGVDASLFDIHDIIYEITEEDIMEEQPYGKTTAIGEGNPKYNVGDKVICHPNGVKAIRKTGVIIANHKEKDKYFYDIVDLDSPMMWKKCSEEDISLTPICPSPSHQFKEITEFMYDTYKKKNADYGDSFGKSVEKYGPIAGLTRISDKFNRLENIILNGDIKVKEETIRDTLLDMSAYCIMLAISLKNLEIS